MAETLAPCREGLVCVDGYCTQLQGLYPVLPGRPASELDPEQETPSH